MIIVFIDLCQLSTRKQASIACVCMWVRACVSRVYCAWIECVRLINVFDMEVFCVSLFSRAHTKMYACVRVRVGAGVW